MPLLSPTTCDRTWCIQHPTGLVLELLPGHAPILHRANCCRIVHARYTWGWVTPTRKLCSEDRKALEAWARIEGLDVVCCLACSGRS